MANWIFTTKHVNRVQEYLAALSEGFRVIKLPKEKHAELFEALKARREESTVFTVAYARALLIGEGCEKNVDAAVALIQPLAKCGDAWAQRNLGVCYENGQGVPRSQEKAKEWYRKAAEQGYEDAQKALEKLKG